MTIPFRIKKLTPTAKIPTKENLGDLWDLYADGFDTSFSKYEPKDGYFKEHWDFDVSGIYKLRKGDRILVKTGIAIELPIKYEKAFEITQQECNSFEQETKFDWEEIEAGWKFKDDYIDGIISDYAVADLRPRSGMALKAGITVLNTPGTIDNSYRKEIGVILINHGHKPYTINKGDKIAQMLIRTLAPSKMEVVESVEDTGRGGFGSTGK